MLDIGSLNVNGDMKSALHDSNLCVARQCNYTGADFQNGNNVDIILYKNKPYPFPPNTFDAVISSSAFEHDSRFWMSFLNMINVLKPGGLLYLNVPYVWTEHRYPVDCWRFFSDSGSALEEWGQDMNYNIHLIYSSKLPNEKIQNVSLIDLVMIFYKPISNISTDEHLNNNTIQSLKRYFSNFTHLYSESMKNPFIYLSFVKAINFRNKLSTFYYNGHYYTVDSDHQITIYPNH